MVEPIRWKEAEEIRQVHPLVRFTDGLPDALRKWSEQFETTQRWFVGYSQAVSILLQIPGGAEYSYIEDERVDFHAHIWRRDPRWPYTMLAEALSKLEAAALLPKALGTARYAPQRLPEQVRGRLSGLGRNELLNVVAECLDRLLIVPFLHDEAGLHDIDGSCEPCWWDRLQKRLEVANGHAPGRTGRKSPTHQRTDARKSRGRAPKRPAI